MTRSKLPKEAVDLKRVRMSRGWSQTRLGEEFDKSQKIVSFWESGTIEIPDKVKQWVKVELENPTELERGIEESGVLSAEYSDSRASFQRRWVERPKRLEHLSGEAIIRPNKEAPAFADADFRITFEGLFVPRNDELYMDCIGVHAPLKKTSDGHCFKELEGSSLKWVEPVHQRGEVGEVPDVQRMLGPHAIGYRLSNVDEEDRVIIRIKAIRGVRAEGIDSIGVPVYEHCPVRFVSIKVKFVGLTPKTRPRAEVYLLSRTSYKSWPLDLAGGVEVDVFEDQTEYFFERLQYPKAGFGYCIAWDSLERK